MQSWQSFVSRRRVHRGAQAAPSLTHPWTTKNSSLPHLASDRPDIAFACKERSRAVRKATRADLTRLKRIGRWVLPHATSRVGVPTTRRGEHRDDRWTDADAAGCPKTRRSTSGGSLRTERHAGDVVVDTEGGVAEQCRIRVLQHGTLCERGHWTPNEVICVRLQISFFFWGTSSA